MYLRHIFLILIVFFLFSCGEKNKPAQKLSLNDFSTWIDTDYRLSARQIRKEINSQQKSGNHNMYTDEYVNKYYSQPNEYLWITPTGVSAKADSLLSFLERVTNDGLPQNVLQVELLKRNIERIHKLEFKNQEDNINQVLGQTEYLLTKSYIRFVCGERFGYIRPDLVFNRLEKADQKPKTPFTRLYDVATEKSDSNFVSNALKQIKSDKFTTYLQSITNKDDLYMQLAQTFKDTTDTTFRKKIIANRERCRWGVEKPKDKFVWVNLAAMRLYAIDTKEDSLEMKICGGSTKHKSPQLISRIERIDMNPYWNIPFNIIKKEIAPLHAQDTAYFTRNKYRIFEKESGKELHPKDVTRRMLLSGDYRIRQDNGDGNSLGRLIFRFPNNFAVFLHDTNNKSAFKRKRRTVSHGCIRVEHPLDLAVFLLDKPEDKQIDKIRTAIGLPPLDPETEIDTTSTSPKLGIMKVEPKIPVFITYYTLYPNLKGELISYPDLYGYDEVILQKLASY